MNAEPVKPGIIMLPAPPAKRNTDRGFTPESEASLAFESLESSIPFLLPPIAPSTAKYTKKPHLPSLSTRLSCPVQLGLVLRMPEATDSKARLTRRMEKRKCAEKARRDALKENMDQVRTLLPTKGKRISKEALVGTAYEYVVALRKQASEKAGVASRLEAEILALKLSMGVL